MKFWFAVLVLTAATVQAQSPDGDRKTTPPTITQTGEGVVSAAPDEGYIVGGAVTFAHKATDALAQNSEAMAKVIAALKNSGVKDSDVATVMFSVDDHFKEVDEGNHTRRIKDGYTVTNKVTVTVCDLSKFGSMIDVMVDAGANEIDSFRLGNSTRESLTNTARTKAVENAIERATLIAKALGYTLGNVVTTHEEVGYDRGVSYAPSGMGAGMSRTSVPIVGGSQDFKIKVITTWTLTKKNTHVKTGPTDRQKRLIELEEMSEEMIKPDPDVILPVEPPGRPILRSTLEAGEGRGPKNVHNPDKK